VPETGGLKPWMWRSNCAVAAFFSVSVIMAALSNLIPVWAVGIGVIQLVVAAVLLWQFDRFRANPENIVVPLAVGMVPRIVLSVAFDEIQDGVARTLGIAAIAMFVVATAILVFRKLATDPSA
jgi:hypothetical protein